MFYFDCIQFVLYQFVETIFVSLKCPILLGSILVSIKAIFVCQYFLLSFFLLGCLSLLLLSFTFFFTYVLKCFVFLRNFFLYFFIVSHSASHLCSSVLSPFFLVPFQDVKFVWFHLFLHRLDHYFTLPICNFWKVSFCYSLFMHLPNPSTADRLTQCQLLTDLNSVFFLLDSMLFQS